MKSWQKKKFYRSDSHKYRFSIEEQTEGREVTITEFRPSKPRFVKYNLQAQHFQLKQLYTGAWGYISKKENLVSTCLYENHRFTSWFAVCWNTCCISKDSFLLRLQSEPRQGSSSCVEQCKLASHPPPSCPAPCTPGNTSDGFASRTPCCHTPEANTNSLNAKYSLLLGSDNLNSSLWKQRNPKQLFLCANLQSSCMGTTPPNFFQNTCKIKIWRERIVIHLPTSVNPFTVWCGTSLWSEIKTLTI